MTSKLPTCITDDSCKTGSTYTGRVVNGRIARAASRVLSFEGGFHVDFCNPNIYSYCTVFH